MGKKNAFEILRGGKIQADRLSRGSSPPTIRLSLSTQGAWNRMSLVGMSFWKTPSVSNSDRPPGGGHTRAQRAAGRGEGNNGVIDAHAT